jgi:hypothetical protein
MPDAPAGVGRERAEGSVATRFSRLMNASTSPLGVVADPAIAGVPSAVLFVAYLAARSRDAAPDVVALLGALAVAPLVLALLATVALLGARGRVVAWLARLPFPLENVNGLLNGVGVELEVRFEPTPAGGAAWPPSRDELNAALERVSGDAFVTTIGDDEPTLDVRIGVLDSKLNPARSNHLRYERVRAICDEVLAPLAASRPIASVRVK